VRLLAARARCFLLRAGELPFSARLFAGVAEATILQRRFYGNLIRLDVSRSNVQRLIYLLGRRFIAERHVVWRLCKPGSVVADVGANIGHYMMLFARHVGPNGLVLSFEPDPENLIELRRNVESHSLCNVEVHAVAVGAADVDVNLQPGLNARVTLDGSGPVVVAQRRLDSVVGGRLDLLKVDVEGYEGHVLAGATRVLRALRPRLFVEIHPWMLVPPYGVDDVVAMLAGTGRRLRALDTAPQSNLLDKMRARYLPRGGVREVSLDALITASRAGDRRESFWIFAE
jgi:FkbM family methyltransferase